MPAQQMSESQMTRTYASAANNRPRTAMRMATQRTVRRYSRLIPHSHKTGPGMCARRVVVYAVAWSKLLASVAVNV